LLRWDHLQLQTDSITTQILEPRVLGGADTSAIAKPPGSTKLIVPSTRRESRAKQTPISVFRLVTSINIFGETKALRNIKEPPDGGSLAQGAWF